MSTGHVVPLQPEAVAAPELRLDLSCQWPLAVITVGGEMDMSTVPQLEDLIDQVVQQRPQLVVLDLADVAFFCAAGVSALIRSRDAVAAAGGQLLLRALSAKTQRVLAITHTLDLLKLDGGDNAG